MSPLRVEIGLVREAGNPYNVEAVEGWLKALNLWRIGHRVLDVDKLTSTDLTPYSVLIAENIKSIRDIEKALETFVEEGESLLLCGSMGPEERDIRFSSTLERLTGVKAISPRLNHKRFRSILITNVHSALKPWLTGEILFFTNPYYSSSAKGRDFEITAFSEPKPHVVAKSVFSELISTEPEVWGNWITSEEPSMIENQKRGLVFYTPVSLGLIDRVLQPLGNGINNYNMNSISYIVENHGILFLMKGLLNYAVEKAGAPLVTLRLWPSGARTVVCLTGDVHEYQSYPPGHARQEYKIMIQMAELLRKHGLSDEYTFSISARVAVNHPEAVKTLSEWDIVPHTYDDVDYAGVGYSYDKQKEDILACIKEFEKVLPRKNSYELGWRTHGYGSNYFTRRALNELGFLWIADMGASWRGEWDFRNFSQLTATYAALPQKARDENGKMLNLWELPEAAPNDVAIYRLIAYSPEDAYRVWKTLFDRAYRQGSLFLILWHPYVTLKEGNFMERTANAESLIDYFKSHEGVRFMNATSVALWWSSRCLTDLPIERGKGSFQGHETLRFKVYNNGELMVRGATLAVLVPTGLQVREVKVNGASFDDYLWEERTLLIPLDLEPQSTKTLEVTFV